MIIRVPHELVVFLFGEKLAPYFNPVCTTLFILGFFIWLFTPKKEEYRIRKEKDTRPVYIEEDEDGNLIYAGVDKNETSEEFHFQEEYFGQYDRYSNLTDEEMRLAMQIRVERKEPTYEEWKAAREAEKHPEG